MASKKQTNTRTKKREYHIPKGAGLGAAGTGVALLTNKEAGQRSALEYLMLKNPASAIDRVKAQMKNTENYIPLGAGIATTVVTTGTKFGRKINNRLPPAWRL